MLIQGQVGPTSTQSASPGSTPAVRLGQLGDVVVSELHGRYFETTYRRALFTATSAAQTASSGIIALGSAYTGLALYNPPGTNVVLSINKVGVGVAVAPAAVSVIGITTGTSTALPTSTTAATATRSGYVTGLSAPSQGQAYNIATFGTGASTGGTTPVVHTILGQLGTTATTQPMLFDIEGSIVLPPGAFAQMYMSTTSGSSGMLYSIQWEEIPL